MDISQQAGNKRKSVSEFKNIYSAILHIFQYEKLNNTTAAHSSLLGVRHLCRTHFLTADLIKRRNMNFDYNETKVCKKCWRELPLDRFGINHNYTRNVCKECFNEGMREKRYQQRLSDSIETYHKDKSMKIQRKYKKPYHFQILYRSESGIDTIAKDEVFVRLFDYKSVWISNYGRIIEKLDDSTYQLVKGVYSRATKELTYTLDRNVYFSSKNTWGYRKEKVTASDLVIKLFVVNYDMKNNTMVWHKNNDTKDNYY